MDFISELDFIFHDINIIYELEEYYHSNFFIDIIKSDKKIIIFNAKTRSIKQIDLMCPKIDEIYTWFHISKKVTYITSSNCKFVFDISTLDNYPKKM